MAKYLPKKLLSLDPPKEMDREDPDAHVTYMHIFIACKSLFAFIIFGFAQCMLHPKLKKMKEKKKKDKKKHLNSPDHLYTTEVSDFFLTVSDPQCCPCLPLESSPRPPTGLSRHSFLDLCTIAQTTMFPRPQTHSPARACPDPPPNPPHALCAPIECSIETGEHEKPWASKKKKRSHWVLALSQSQGAFLLLVLLLLTWRHPLKLGSQSPPPRSGSEAEDHAGTPCCGHGCSNS